jgi:two-component system, OmpR family, response regulator VanR
MGCVWKRSRIVASGSGIPILMLTAADRLDDKATGFGLGADDYLTKPFDLRELVLRLRADRRRAHNRPPVREIAGLRLDPLRREVHFDGRYIASPANSSPCSTSSSTPKNPWNARGTSTPTRSPTPCVSPSRPCANISALRKRFGEPGIIATVPGVGYRIDTERGSSERADDTALGTRAWTRRVRGAAPGVLRRPPAERLTG